VVPAGSRELIRYGRVHDGRRARLDAGAVASACDLTVARWSVHGKAIVNLHVYQVQAVHQRCWA